MSSDLAVIATKTVRPCIHHDNNQRSLYKLSIYAINMDTVSFSAIHFFSDFEFVLYWYTLLIWINEYRLMSKKNKIIMSCIIWPK
jgi:hypothetical protein